MKTLTEIKNFAGKQILNEVRNLKNLPTKKMVEVEKEIILAKMEAFASMMYFQFGEAETILNWKEAMTELINS